MYEFYIMLVLLAINVILIFFPRVSILNFIFGVISILISIQCFSNADIPFQPYFTLLLFLTSIASLLSAVISLKSD